MIEHIPMISYILPRWWYIHAYRQGDNILYYCINSYDKRQDGNVFYDYAYSCIIHWTIIVFVNVKKVGRYVLYDCTYSYYDQWDSNMIMIICKVGICFTISDKTEIHFMIIHITIMIIEIAIYLWLLIRRVCAS